MFLTTRLSDHGKLESVGGTSVLAQLISKTVSSVNIDRYALLVKNKGSSREGIKTSHQMAAIFGDSTLSWEDQITEVTRIFRDFCQSRQSEKDGRLLHISQALSELYDDVERGNKPGIDTGLVPFDLATGGLSRGDLHIVAGRPGMGKSQFSLFLAKSIAQLHNYPVIYFSLEMSTSQWIRRVVAQETQLRLDHLRDNSLSEEEQIKLGERTGHLHSIPVHIDDTGCPSLEYIRNCCDRIADSTGKPPIPIIDYLQLMVKGQSRSYTTTLAQEVGILSRGLKLLAMDHGVPVIAVSQLNRGVEARNDKRPMMSDLRESGDLEQDASTITMLYRDSYYNPNTRTQGETELILVKNRNGVAPHTVKVMNDLPTGSFIAKA
jgi:replicative DNA helicase